MEITYQNEQFKHSVHPPPFCLGWEGGLNLQPYFHNRTGPQLLEGGCWERGVAFFRGGVQFSQKNTLKSEIFNDKKSLLAKTFFSVVTKNSNQEISPKNLVIYF